MSKQVEVKADAIKFLSFLRMMEPIPVTATYAVSETDFGRNLVVAATGFNITLPTSLSRDGIVIITTAVAPNTNNLVNTSSGSSINVEDPANPFTANQVIPITAFFNYIECRYKQSTNKWYIKRGNTLAAGKSGENIVPLDFRVALGLDDGTGHIPEAKLPTVITANVQLQNVSANTPGTNYLGLDAQGRIILGNNADLGGVPYTPVYKHRVHKSESLALARVKGQCMRILITALITVAGNAQFVFTSAVSPGSPITVNYAVAVGDDDSAVAYKLVQALLANSAIANNYYVEYFGRTIQFQTKAYAATDGTLAGVSQNGTCTGVTTTNAAATTAVWIPIGKFSFVSTEVAQGNRWKLRGEAFVSFSSAYVGARSIGFRYGNSTNASGGPITSIPLTDNATNSVLKSRISIHTPALMGAPAGGVTNFQIAAANTGKVSATMDTKITTAGVVEGITLPVSTDSSLTAFRVNVGQKQELFVFYSIAIDTSYAGSTDLSLDMELIPEAE